MYLSKVFSFPLTLFLFCLPVIPISLLSYTDFSSSSFLPPRCLVHLHALCCTSLPLPSLSILYLFLDSTNLFFRLHPFFPNISSSSFSRVTPFLPSFLLSPLSLFSPFFHCTPLFSFQKFSKFSLILYSRIDSLSPIESP